MRISDWSSDVCSSDLMVVLNMCLLGMLGSDHFLLCVFARAQGYIPRDMLPNMPRKTLTTTLALREEIVLTRKQKLQRYLSVVMERSEEHTSELQSLMRTSYAVFCLKKKNKLKNRTDT